MADDPPLDDFDVLPIRDALERVDRVDDDDERLELLVRRLSREVHRLRGTLEVLLTPGGEIDRTIKARLDVLEGSREDARVARLAHRRRVWAAWIVLVALSVLSGFYRVRHDAVRDLVVQQQSAAQAFLYSCEAREAQAEVQRQEIDILTEVFTTSTTADPVRRAELEGFAARLADLNVPHVPCADQLEAVTS